MADMVKVLKKIILVDLKSFVMYLDGVIKIDYEEERRVEEAMKSRLKIRGVVNSRGGQEY